MEEQFQQLNKFQQLYDRVLSDSEFRIMLASNPEKALRTVDIEPTKRILDALKSVRRDIEKLEDIFGDRNEFFAP
jgi:hypothetical protein